MADRDFAAFRPLANSIRVRAATTANITIATALNAGDTLDGVTLVDGMLVLVKDQTAPAENGIYVVGTVPRRYTDFSADVRGSSGAYDMHPGLIVAVEQGTLNINTTWVCTSVRSGTLGTTSIAFAYIPNAGGGTPARTRFWTNIDDGYPAPPAIVRMRERVFVGAMVGSSGAQAADTGYWLGEATEGPNWIPRDSHLAVVADNGAIAVSGSSRASDKGGFHAAACIGGAFYADSDVASGTAWGGYFEAFRNASGSTGWAIEVDARNTQSAISINPYDIFGTGTAGGILLTGGGDTSYGPVPAAHSGSAISTGGAGRTYKWQQALMVQAGSLSGSDGTDASATTAQAIVLPRQHQIEWFAEGGVKKVQLRSSLISTDVDWTQYWSGDHLFFARNAAAENVFRLAGVASAANYISLTNAAAGVQPVFSAVGSDTNISIGFTPKGTGVVRSAASFLAHAATAIPAGGTAGAGFVFSSTANFGVFFGSGAPSLSAAKGSLYLRSDGSGTTDRAYINTNGSTTWTALTTVA